MMTRRPFECLSEGMLILLPFNSFCKNHGFVEGIGVITKLLKYWVTLVALVAIVYE